MTGTVPLSKRELISLIDLEVDRVKECEAEIARLTEENRALVEAVEQQQRWIRVLESDEECDWGHWGIQMHEAVEAVEPILARHQEEASR